jgi:hypothetical protein
MKRSVGRPSYREENKFKKNLRKIGYGKLVTVTCNRSQRTVIVEFCFHTCKQKAFF